MSQQSTTTPDSRSILDRARTDTETTLTADDWDEISDEIKRNLYDTASTDEVYQAVIQALTARVERDPALKRVAAAVFRQRYYRQVLGENLSGFDLDRAYRDTFTANLKHAVDIDLLDARLTERFDLADLAEYLEPDRDQKFEYMYMAI